MLHAVPPGQEVDSWLICTRAFQRRYGLGIARPAPLPLRPYIRSRYVKVGGTIAELARNCGIDPEGLERTVTEYKYTPARERTPPSAAAAPPTTATKGTPEISQTPAWRRSSAGRSTP